MASHTVPQRHQRLAGMLFATGVLACLALVGCGQTLPEGDADASLQPQGLTTYVRTYGVVGPTAGFGGNEAITHSCARVNAPTKCAWNIVRTEKYAVTMSDGLNFEAAWDKVQRLLGASVKASFSRTNAGTYEASIAVSDVGDVTLQSGQSYNRYLSAAGQHFNGWQQTCYRVTNVCETPVRFKMFVPTGSRYRGQLYDSTGWCKDTPPHGDWYNFKQWPPVGGIKTYPVYLGGPMISVQSGVYATPGWYGAGEEGYSVKGGGYMVYKAVDPSKCYPADLSTLPPAPKS
jgi:hypothetical protein